jgi:hypothetical protein
MNRRIWRDYDDGFDEATLYDELDDFVLESLRKRRKVESGAKHGRKPRSHRPSGLDRESDDEPTRSNAWGAPY